jgi:biotin transport system substrate-specific component
MVLAAVMTAATCIIGPFSVPLPVTMVPITFVNLMIFLSAYLLGMRTATITVLLYLLLGFVGLPVFAGGNAGAGVLAGPTGGYLIGYVLLVLIAGYFSRGGNRWKYLAGMLLGSLVLDIFGTVWLSYQAGMDFRAALFAGVIPFIPGDVIKILAAMAIAPRMKAMISRHL